MEKLRPAVKNGSTVVAACPIRAHCECGSEEDRGRTISCGFLKGYLKDRKGLKVRCEYVKD